MMSEKRRENLAQRIESMRRFGGVAGATVLEIGADANGFAAQMLLDAGARHVFSTNYHEAWPTETVGAIERRRADARRLEDTFEAQSVDVVFGVAVLEHIDGLPQFFAGAKHALRPGGLFFVHGGPIWSSSKGHHIFVRGEKAHYKFGDAKTNPIRDWSHLAHDKASLTAELLDRGIYPADARLIAAWIYEGDGINRVGYRTMCDAFERSPLKLVERQDAAFRSPPPDMLDAIARGPYAGQDRFDVSGVTFVARA